MIPTPTIDELISRYDLEPTLQDVYVEGKFDRDVLNKSCIESDSHDRVIYEIDIVDIPFQILDKYSLTEGNKQRVIALAKELSVIDKKCKYACIVDKDLDHWFGKVESVPRLFWTEYCAMELYFFNEEYISKTLNITLNCKFTSWSGFYNSFVLALTSFYALRLADFELNLGLTWLSFDKNLKVANGIINFNDNDYINKLLINTSRSKLKKEFTDSYRNWMQKVSGDPRYWIRGHDFVDLIIWVIKIFKGHKELANAVAVQSILISSTRDIGNVLLSLEC